MIQDIGAYKTGSESFDVTILTALWSEKDGRLLVCTINIHFTQPNEMEKMAKKPEKPKNTEILVAKWETKKIFFSEPGKPVNNELPTFQVIFISK